MRNIPLKVYGASGWDRDAFLMPGVNLNFTNKIEYKNLSVVVLNLRAPSVLLGFRLGGIVGYKFLSRYRVAINLDKSIVQLQAAAAAEETGELKLGSDASRSRVRPPVLARRCRRSARRTSAAACCRFSSSVSTPKRRNLRAHAVPLERHERQVRPARHLPPARQRLLRYTFTSTSSDVVNVGGHARLQDDEIAHLDGVEELEAVDRRRHHQLAGMPERRDRARRYR